ncbi:hypothetical protein [Haloarcula amylovorans]|uniref:hypothetical protein n=1 Tax=Haloarcula amylovorans TaxID=2562280 RepID=UPI0010769939|nr:hypothetical protein [Halomicroarcula amylolytica]
MSEEQAERPTQTREQAAHPGIDGTWHHYGRLPWWSPEDLYDDGYARPQCPATIASSPGGHKCGVICERINDDEGRGAWFCFQHGDFRVFDWPRESGRTEQTLLTEVGV